jgi:hypothetical protein
MKKETKAVIFNALIVILGIVGLVELYSNNKSLLLEFYTVESNILAIITSFLYLLFHKKNYEWLRDLKYISTTCLTVTFLVVIFILAPMDHFNYKFYLLKGAMLYQHTLCPIFAILTYLLFEKRSKKAHLCLVYTSIYTVVMVILNLTNKIVGPYFFLMVKVQPIYKTIFWFIIIYSLNYLIGLFLTKFRANN